MPSTTTTTEKQPLTRRQFAVLSAIVRHIRDHGQAPTVRELCAVLGISSPNGVVCHLAALARKGHIDWRPRSEGGAAKSRGIEVPEITAVLKAAADEYLRRIA